MVDISTEQSWITLNDHQIFERTEFACGMHEHQFIILAGGRKGFKSLQSVIMYNIRTNTYIKRLYVQSWMIIFCYP